MASPFKVFRKHQKVMLALLAILAMFGFVILPMVLQGMGFGERRDPLVATTAEYGDLNASHLDHMRRQRRLAAGFLTALAAEIDAQGGDSRELGPTINRISSTDEEQVVYRWLLARRAEQLGLVIDDNTIEELLRYWGQNKVSLEQMGALLRRLRAREQDLFAALREELLALRLEEMFDLSLRGTTPAQRWDFFQRLNRRVSIQSVPVPVSDFVDQVADPDEATLREFFDEHKAQPHDPNYSPEPGFREPQKIAVEYLKAEYDAFVLLDKVTDEEIKAYYEQNKQRHYRQQALPTPDEEEPEKPPAEDSDAKEAAKQGPKDSDSDKSAAPEEPEPSPEQQTSKATDTEAADPKPPTTTPADDSASEKPEPGLKPEPKPESKPKLEPAATRDEPKPEPTPTEDVNRKPANPSDASDTSLSAPASPFRLTAFSQENATENSTEAASADSKPPTAEPAKPTAEPAKPAPETTPPEQPKEEAASVEPPSSDLASPEKPAAPPKEQPEGAAKPDAEAADEAADTTADTAKDAPEPVRYKPLEEVEPEIRRNLARTKAHGEIKKVLNQVKIAHLKRYREEMALEQEPARVGFHALAKEHNLIAYQPKTPKLMSALEARDTDIGKSTINGVQFTYHAFQRMPLQKGGLQVSQPEISSDQSGDYYLFWKVDDVQQRVPEFDDPGVRERVLRQWKTIQARGLAEAEAKRLSEEAAKRVDPLVAQARKKEAEAKRLARGGRGNEPEAQQQLEEAERAAKEASDEAERLWTEASEAFGKVFQDRADAAVTESELFTWLTHGNVAPWLAMRVRPDISEVKGVEVPRNDFMRAVFRLEKGEIGTAMNHPKTVVYVFRVTQSTPSAQSLWDRFVQETYQFYLGASWPETAPAYRAWLEGIKREAGFQWDPEWQRESLRGQVAYE